MKVISLVLLALVVSLLVAPASLAQGVPSGVKKCSKECDPKEVNGGTIKKGNEGVTAILYGHFEDILNRAPLNTQMPDADKEPDLNRGFLMPVIDTNTGTPADFHFKNNEFIMFSSPGLVEYLTEGWRTHQEPGLASDVRIAADSFNLYWYMSAHNIPNQNSGNSAPIGVMPQVAVFAQMNTGRFPFRGTVIATSEPVDAAPGDPSRVNMISTPVSDGDVFEFQVKMKVANKIIPGSETANGFIVYVNPYQVKSGAQAQLAQADWRVRTGVNFPPRVVIPIENPMENRASSLTLFDNRMFIRWSFVSAWGSYDIDDASLKIDSTGANKLDAKAVEFIILKRSVDHDGHFKPVNATWALDYTNFPLPDGDYELTASVVNRQGTYMLEQKFPFKVVKGVPEVTAIGSGKAGAAASAAGGAKSEAGGNSPGFDAVLLAVGVASAALVGLRRRRG